MPYAEVHWLKAESAVLQAGFDLTGSGQPSNTPGYALTATTQSAGYFRQRLNPKAYRLIKP